METEQVVTMDALAAKAAAKRSEIAEQRAVTAAGGSANDGRLVAWEDGRSRCPDCGAERTYRRPAGLSTTAVRVAKCDVCREREALECAEREDAERRAARERTMRRRADGIIELLEESGVNVREHGGSSMATFDASACGDVPSARLLQWLDATRQAGPHDPVLGLYLWGDTGTGKTHLAVAALRELLLDPEIDPGSVVYDYAPRLMLEIQDTYSSGRSTEALLDRRAKARIWILDDLGAERASDDAVQRLTLIFHERALAPTLVTSNVAPGALESRHPGMARVASRCAPGYFRAVEVRGPDRRFTARPTGSAA